MAVDADGKQIARPGVEYKVERTDWIYQWYEVDGRWRWQAIANDAAGGGRHRGAARPIAGAAHLTPELGPPSPHGHRPREQHLQHTQFYVGWYGGRQRRGDARHAARGERQGELHAGRDRALRIEAPFAGEAMLAIATDRVISTCNVKVPAGGTTIDMPVTADWGAGAYALVTAWRPLDKPADRTPTRAIGAVWLGLDPALRTLASRRSARLRR